MPLTLDFVASNPNLFCYEITSGLLMRPLEPTDKPQIKTFIDKLSEKTKRFYSYHEPSANIANEICDAINKYDKLRFALENTDTKEIIGLFEFSFDIPENDLERFKIYDINLSSSDCRLGPILSDDYQSKGLATTILPLLIDIARQFERSRIILWGGVNTDNPQAIRFYEKNNFKILATFVNNNNENCYDMILDIK